MEEIIKDGVEINKRRRRIGEINKIKNWFFKTSYKIYKMLGKW